MEVQIVNSEVRTRVGGMVTGAFFLMENSVYRTTDMFKPPNGEYATYSIPPESGHRACIQQVTGRVIMISVKEDFVCLGSGKLVVFKGDRVVVDEIIAKRI